MTTHPHLEGLYRLADEFDNGSVTGRAYANKLRTALAALPGGGVDAEVAVAVASAELRRAVSNRSQAKKARQLEFSRYANERGEDGHYYPIADHYGVEDTDAGCESAIATYNGAQRAVTAARGKWRSATTRYLATLPTPTPHEADRNG